MGRNPADGDRRRTQRPIGEAAGASTSAPHQHQRQRGKSGDQSRREVTEIEATETDGEAIPTGVIMEGMLKKRGANLPVMRDRYCVATWELDLALNKYVLLRSYKSRQAYDAHPERPSSVHQLKCISDWDGRTSFHRYEHAFIMETYDKKLFHCVAPSADDKAKWVDLMAIHSAFTSVARAAAPSSSRDMRLNSIGSLMPLRRASSVDTNAPANRPRALTGGSGTRPAAGKPRGVSDVLSTDSEGNGMGDHDGLFRSDSTDSAGSSFAPNNSGAKAFSTSASSSDWAFSYGDTLGAAHSKTEGDAASRASMSAAATTAAMMSKFDKDSQAARDEDEEEERRRRSVMLDQELLRKTQVEKNPMASDSFLFDDAGASRFGAVVVKPASNNERDGESDSDSVDDLIDQELVQRLEREESEKQMKRRAKKLESNRDLYAEMAAARLNDMRKLARQPKKSTPRHHHHSDRARVESMASTVLPSSHVAFYESDSGDEYVDAGDDFISGEASHKAEDVAPVETRRKSSAVDQGKMSLDDLDHEAEADEHEAEVVADEVADEAVDIPSKKEKKAKSSKKKAKSHSVSLGAMSADERKELMVGYEQEDESVYHSDGEEPIASSSHKKRSKHKSKRAQEGEAIGEPIADLDNEEEVEDAVAPPIDPMMEAARLQEEEEERKRAKQKRKEERRAKKELQRQQEEEAAAAAAAADLARQHLETMRTREEEKRRVELEKQEKKERRELKERVKLEKAKQRRAEAELKKLVEMKKAEEERREQEKREREWEKRKAKRRDKYTSPTERIQKMEQHAVSATQATNESSSDLSSALVVVESNDAKAEAPVAPTTTPRVPEAVASPAVADAAPAQPTSAPAPAPAPAPVAAPSSAPVAPVVSETPAVPVAPQSLPAYGTTPVQVPYMPGYPYMVPPPMSAPQSYPYVQYPHLPYPAAFATPTAAPSSGYGVPIPPPYLQPHLGYVSGVPSMPTLPRTFPEPPPAVQTVEEKPAMIGPQLPEGLYPASLARASSATTATTLPDLPDLPDVVEF